MTNIILDKYLHKLTNLFQLLQDDDFWLTCNRDEDGQYLFFIAPSKIEKFDWGTIIINEIEDLENLLQTEIIYLIPRPPSFQANQQTNGYPQP